MLYDENIFLPTRNPAFLHQTDKRFRKKRSTGSILKGTPPYTYIRVQTISRSRLARSRLCPHDGDCKHQMGPRYRLPLREPRTASIANGDGTRFPANLTSSI